MFAQILYIRNLSINFLATTFQLPTHPYTGTLSFHQIETKKVFEQQLWNMDLSGVDEQELKKYGWIKLKVVNNWRWIYNSSFTKEQPEKKMRQGTMMHSSTWGKTEIKVNEKVTKEVKVESKLTFWYNLLRTKGHWKPKMNNDDTNDQSAH